VRTETYRTPEVGILAKGPTTQGTYDPTPSVEVPFGPGLLCDTKSSLSLCRVAEQRRHLPFCRQYPTGTGVTTRSEAPGTT